MSEQFIPRVITGEDVVREARRYLGVPFKHRGEDFDGIDCSGITLAVGRALSQVPPGYRRPPYSLRPDPVLFLREMLMLANPVERGQERPGDGVLMCHGGSDRRIRHVAFLTDLGDGPGLLHIFPAMSIRRVAQHHLDDIWRGRMLRFVRYKGVRWA